MNRSYLLVFGVAIALLLIANLLPRHGNAQLECPDDTVHYSRPATIFGLPFGFYKTISNGNECSTEDNTYSHIFTPAALWFDLIITGGLLTGAYLILDQRGTRR